MSTIHSNLVNPQLDFRVYAGSLLSGTTVGCWFDPSDLSTVFTDVAGTTPANVGDAVALIKDKSGNGNDASQATADQRPILRQSAAGRYYLEFDGGNDGLKTGSISFSANSDLTILCGVSFADKNGNQTLFSSNSRNPWYFKRRNGLDGALSFNTSADGDFLGSTDLGDGVHVISTLISAGDNEHRIDFASDATSASSLTYTMDEVWIGVGSDTFNELEGDLYSFIIAGSANQESAIKLAEHFVNGKTNG